MKTRKWRSYAFWIALSEAAGILSGWLSRRGRSLYQAATAKPPLTPPAPVFPVVWTVLFLLLGIGAARVYLSPASGARSRGLLLFLLHLAVNFFWSILFFNLQAFFLAFLWIILLWVLILGMIRSFAKADKTAALLQIPYLLWVPFAVYLNLGVWLLNR